MTFSLFGNAGPSQNAMRVGQINAQNAQIAGQNALNLGVQNSVTAAQQGRQGALDAINAGEPMSLGAIGQGYGDARGAYEGARSYFDPYAETGMRGFNLFADSTGANGQAAADAARAAFRASPGYAYQVAEASDAAARAGSSQGMLGSGNVAAAIADRAQNIADQDFQGWQSNLQGLGQVGYDATGKQSALTKGLGDLGVQQGRDTAGIFDTNAARRANAWTGAASAIGNAWTGYGNSSAALAPRTAQMSTDAANVGARGQQDAHNAEVNGWMALGNLGVNAARAGAMLA